jgi:hypothetical protein
MTKRARPARVRYYIDADLLGLAKILIQVRTDVTYLAADDAIGTFAQFEVLMCQWRRIEALIEEEGPFIYSVTRTSFRRIEL